jgi:hypothetical protein
MELRCQLKPTTIRESELKIHNGDYLIVHNISKLKTSTVKHAAPAAAAVVVGTALG